MSGECEPSSHNALVICHFDGDLQYEQTAGLPPEAALPSEANSTRPGEPNTATAVLAYSAISSSSCGGRPLRARMTLPSRASRAIASVRLPVLTAPARDATPHSRHALICEVGVRRRARLRIATSGGTPALVDWQPGELNPLVSSGRLLGPGAINLPPGPSAYIPLTRLSSNAMFWGGQLRG